MTTAQAVATLADLLIAQSGHSCVSGRWAYAFDVDASCGRLDMVHDGDEVLPGTWPCSVKDYP